MNRSEMDPTQMRRMEELCREIGNIIGRTVDDIGEKGHQGFALMIFSFDGPEFTWVSNARRADMVKVMEEFIRRNPPDQTSEQRN